MLKELSRRLQHCNDIAVRINNANDSQLQELKTQLVQQMGKPVGLHTMGIPAAISTLGVIVSFAIPQLWLGYGVFAALNQPAEKVFVWVVLIALLFAGINGLTMFMMGKGSIRAVRVHAMYAATDVDDPHRWYFYEIYASEEDYQLHRQTPHFRDYLKQTAHMSTRKTSIPVKPLFLRNKGGITAEIAPGG